MPEKDEIRSAMEELQAIADQKRVLIDESSETYAKLDADIKELIKQKKELEAVLLTLKSAKDDAENIIEKAKAQAVQIISGASADGKNIVLDAMRDAEKVNKEAILDKERAQDLFMSFRAKDEEASLLKTQAEILKKEADLDKQNAGIKLVEANMLLSDAEKKIDAISKSNELITNELKSLRERESAISKAEEEIKSAKESISNASIAISSRAEGLDTEKKAFDAFKSEKIEEIARSLATIEETKAMLIKQKENNAFKNAELDAGFSKLKRDQEEVRKQNIIIEATKKELSK